jgi:mono/diheme cytochrome c family protein
MAGVVIKGALMASFALCVLATPLTAAAATATPPAVAASPTPSPSPAMSPASAPSPKASELSAPPAPAPSGEAVPVNAANDDLVKRGYYLMRAADCMSCHTNPKGGVALAGGRKMDTPFGPIYPPNITPDKATGIGAYSDDDFWRVLHEGIRKDGAYLYPVMPFPWYTNMTRQDAMAIKAYLFSLKPIHAENKPPGFPFPFNVRESLLTWRTLFFKQGKPPQTAPMDGVARGEYLVEALGHCGECHNKHKLLGNSIWDGKFQGGEIEGWYAPNITSDGRQGVGAWSVDQIARFLKAGIAPHSGVALGPMAETIEYSLRYLKDDDLKAMAEYIKSIKPKETYANSAGALSKPGAPGETLFQNHCASCHGLTGEGVKGHVPALAHNGAVQAREPDDVIRVVLGGLTPQKGLGPMPAIGADLSDADVARIVDYVRNNFGNAAPAATKPSKVAELRAKTRTPMLAASRGDCDTPQTSQVKALVASGEIDKLAKGDPVKLLPGIDELATKLAPANPLQVDAYVTDLTGAYCQALFTGAATAEPARADKLGRFAALAYSRMETKIGQ